MKHNRKSISKELKPVADREEKSVMDVYNTKQKIMLVSYIDKKKSGKKNVIVLSTIHDNVKITKDQWKKPSVHTMHDRTKGGINVVNILSTTHSTWIKSRRWALYPLGFILETYHSNAKTIMQDNGIKLTNLEMTYNLRKEFVLPVMKKRYSQWNGLKITVINKIRCVLGFNEVSAHPQLENFNSASSKCFKCVEAIIGKKSYKAEREKLNNKLKTICSKCQKFLSRKHQNVIYLWKLYWVTKHS